MSDIITLFCLIHGYSVDHAFSVQIGKTGTVNDLRAVIKAMKKPDLEQVNIGDLVLWKVNISVDKFDTFDPNAAVTTLKDSKRLYPVQKIGKIFPTDDEADDECLHIIVHTPPLVKEIRIYLTIELLINCEESSFTWMPTLEHITLLDLWNEIRRRDETRYDFMEGAIIPWRTEKPNPYMILKDDTDLINLVKANYETTKLALHIKKTVFW